MHKPTTLVEFNSLLKLQGKVFVYYTASWCGPCRKISPLFDTLQNVITVKVDADDGSRILDAQEVHVLPTVDVWENGVRKHRIEGITAGALTNLHIAETKL